MKRLHELPQLEAWYSQRLASPPSGDEGLDDHICWQICHAFTQDNPCAAYKQWAQAFARFLQSSPNPRDDYQRLDYFFSTAGFSLNEQCSTLGHYAFDCEQADAFFILMQKAAEKTRLASFYFLAAWTAFNSKRYEACLQECQKVPAPLAPLLTLKGQALLEACRPEEACQALEEALELDPHSLLAWFQLAKAEWVQDHLDKAWHALEACDNLAPNHYEVAIFQSLIALELPASSAYRSIWLEQAWNKASVHLEHFKQDDAMVARLLALACQCQKKEWAYKVVAIVNWRQWWPAGDKPSQKLATILRQLGERGWYDLAERVLTPLGPHAQG